MSEFDDDIAMVVEEMEKEMQQERKERESRREEISMPPNLPSAPTTYGPHDLPERLRGTAIMNVHVPKLPEFGEEPETAPNVVSAAFREADTSTVSADLRLNITRMIEGGDAADEWIAWARTRLAAMNDAISKSSQAVMDARYRAYHICMIDSSTDSVYAPHTRQPIAIFEDGKMMPNARHPYYLG